MIGASVTAKGERIAVRGAALPRSGDAGVASAARCALTPAKGVSAAHGRRWSSGAGPTGRGTVHPGGRGKNAGNGHVTHRLGAAGGAAPVL